VPVAGHAQLALKFKAASWVEVYDARGRRLLHRVEAADSARTLAGAAPLRVVLGNAPGVALQLNGQAVPLEGLVHHDGSAHIVIDGSGRASATHTGVPRG
jgi:cytoskeleton protein RodZ